MSTLPKLPLSIQPWKVSHLQWNPLVQKVDVLCNEFTAEILTYMKSRVPKGHKQKTIRSHVQNLLNKPRYSLLKQHHTYGRTFPSNSWIYRRKIQLNQKNLSDLFLESKRRRFFWKPWKTVKVQLWPSHKPFGTLNFCNKNVVWTFNFRTVLKRKFEWVHLIFQIQWGRSVRPQDFRGPSWSPQ